MGFFETYEDKAERPVTPAIDHGPSQNKLAGFCSLCRRLRRTVLLGICEDCA